MRKVRKREKKSATVTVEIAVRRRGDTRMRKYKPVMLQTRSSLFLLSFYFRAAHSVINVILLSEKDT